MRISDWSSDVCSSYLRLRLAVRGAGDSRGGRGTPGAAGAEDIGAGVRAAGGPIRKPALAASKQGVHLLHEAQHGTRLRHIGLRASLQIGRASCRERVCPYVSISVVASTLKKKQ